MGNVFALLAFLRSIQSSIARDCERELKEASRGTLGGLKMFYWVFEEGEQWRACANGLLLMLDQSFPQGLECRAEPSEKKVHRKRFSSN